VVVEWTWKNTNSFPVIFWWVGYGDEGCKLKKDRVFVAGELKGGTTGRGHVFLATDVEYNPVDTYIVGNKATQHWDIENTSPILPGRFLEQLQSLAAEEAEAAKEAAAIAAKEAAASAAEQAAAKEAAASAAEQAAAKDAAEQPAAHAADEPPVLAEVQAAVPASASPTTPADPLVTKQPDQENIRKALVQPPHLPETDQPAQQETSAQQQDVLPTDDSSIPLNLSEGALPSVPSSLPETTQPTQSQVGHSRVPNQIATTTKAITQISVQEQETEGDLTFQSSQPQNSESFKKKEMNL
jgi:hypothetical protein